VSAARIILVAALDRRRAIGVDGKLPWHLPDDLKRFKALTLGRTILMGRRTAESLGRALPGRTNLVLTRHGRAPFEHMLAVPTLDAALEDARGAELVVIGGGEVYALALPRAQLLQLTLVDTELARADTWFPEWRAADWDEAGCVAHAADARHAFAFRFVDLARRA